MGAKDGLRGGKISSQILLALSIMFLTVISVLTITLYSITSRTMVDTATDSALRIASSLAGKLDGDTLNTLVSPEDEGNDDYNVIRKLLIDTRDASGSRFVYIMRKTANGQFEYVVDASEGDEHCNLGDIEEETSSEEDLAWSGTANKSSVLGVYEEWGCITYAYAPVTDSSGKVAAIVGVDYDAQREYEGLRRFTLYSIIIAVAGIAICYIPGSILAKGLSRPIMETAEFAEQLAKGNLDAPLLIKANNEIGRLACVLDNNVRQAFKDVEHASTVSAKRAKYQEQSTQAVLRNLERLANGELVCDMQIAPADEDTQDIYDIFTDTEHYMRQAVDTLKALINEMSCVLQSVARGDLTWRISAHYPGDFADLKFSINHIIEGLNTSFTDVSSAAAQVALGTAHLAAGSSELARGATEQAGAIGRLALSVREIQIQSETSVNNAMQANLLTDSAREDTLKCNSKMDELRRAMDEISVASADVQKIIKVIDDIAFQTNILAINANVEASHAGVHGKGFGVVAEEVRTLAAKCAQAAHETAMLIQESVEKANNGAEIANETAQMLQNSVASTESAGNMINEIVGASSWQMQQISKINDELSHVERVVQQNASVSEETAATSEQLSGQSESMHALVAQFKLTNGTRQLNE